MNLRERIAVRLGWTVEETKGFSFQSLRELVRGAGDAKLTHELDVAIRSGSYIIQRES